MRLLIDDLVPLAALRPGVNPGQASQIIDGVLIERWTQQFDLDPAISAADVVIEAFGCSPPNNYLAAMARRKFAPVWINLEYLSAETWIKDFHRLASPHPRLPLTKFFFFPGFTPDSGGLLPGSLNNQAQTPAIDKHGLRISLFCYRVAPLLLECWASSAVPIHCLVADGLPRQQVAAWLNQLFNPGDQVRRQRLTLTALPFLAQTDYDELLTSCALNFVRGEDSFVRAQWAQRPLVWQIYPQADDAHLPKLNAFIQRYSTNLSPQAAQAFNDFWRAWNGLGDLADTWSAFHTHLSEYAAHARPWAQKLSQAGDLTEKLAQFALPLLPAYNR